MDCLQTPETVQPRIAKSPAENAPELLDGLNSDLEAGSYSACYELTEKNEKKAERLAEIIISLIEDEEELYRIVREHGEKFNGTDQSSAMKTTS